LPGFTQVFDCQLDSPSTRERPPDIAGHAATTALTAIVDLNERTLAFKVAVAGAVCHTGIMARRRGFAALLGAISALSFRFDAEDHDFHLFLG
jgi:hypothetical protein